MPDTSLLSPYVVKLDGGLILDKDAFHAPGAALELINFEPDISRWLPPYQRLLQVQFEHCTADKRIHGKGSWRSDIQRQYHCCAGREGIQGRYDRLVDCIQTGRTNAERYSFVVYNFDNTEKIIYVDGANNAAMSYNNTSVTDVSTTGAPADPSFVEVHKSHVFFAGMSSNPQEVVFSAPVQRNRLFCSKRCRINQGRWQSSRASRSSVTLCTFL